MPIVVAWIRRARIDNCNIIEYFINTFIPQPLKFLAPPKFYFDDNFTFQAILSLKIFCTLTDIAAIRNYTCSVVKA